MAQGPEAKVKKKLRKWIHDTWPHAWTYMAPGGPYGRKGVPDILACICGVFVAIEVKAREGMEPTPIQMHELKLISKADGITCVFDGYNELKLIKLKDEVENHVAYRGDRGRAMSITIDGGPKKDIQIP